MKLDLTLEGINPRILELAEEYKDVIVGILGYTWNIPLEETEKINDKLEKLLQAQFIFFLKKLQQEEIIK